MVGGVNMNVRFIDTSIMTNILDVPGRNAEREVVMAELKEAINSKDTLILPAATIIETGNHIVHSQNSYNVATEFCKYLRKTANGEAPWIIYEKQLQKDDLLYIADNWGTYVASGTGIGDMSIIRVYKKYIETEPAIGTVMIWSLDTHLSSYRQENIGMSRRRNR